MVHFSIKSSIVLIFKNSELCSYCYNSFYPELNSIESNRSSISMEKKDNSLTFTIESNDSDEPLIEVPLSGTGVK